MKPFELSRAATLDAALRDLRAGDGQVLKAGGIDLLDLMKEELIAPKRLVSIVGVDPLAKIDALSGGRLRLGALTPLHQLAEDATVRSLLPALSDACGGAATPQIRRVATLGGNLHQRPRCWYFRSAEFPCLKKGGSTCYAQAGENRFHAIFDNTRCAAVHASAAATALLAYDAMLVIASSPAAGQGSRREAALSKHFVKPEEDVTREHRLLAGDIVEAVLVPAAAPGKERKSAYLKMKERQAFDWPLAEVAVVLELDGTKCTSARIVLGAAAPVPWRSEEAEAQLTGKVIDESLARSAGAAAVRVATPLAQNGYKTQLFEVLVRRAILAAIGGAK